MCPLRDYKLHDGKTELHPYFPSHTSVNHMLKPKPEGHTGGASWWEALQADSMHALTHTAGVRCGGSAHVPPSGQAWAGSSRCIWHGFLAGCTHSPGLPTDRTKGHCVLGHRQKEQMKTNLGDGYKLHTKTHRQTSMNTQENSGPFPSTDN